MGVESSINSNEAPSKPTTIDPIITYQLKMKMAHIVGGNVWKIT